ncbi:9734_t:CDS:2, partial [Gigaspora margarita]
MDQQREDQNCTPVYGLVSDLDVNNNQNPEPLHIVLQEIANTFREATLGTTTTTHSILRKNNLVQ